jgi:hypothetical protein
MTTPESYGKWHEFDEVDWMGFGGPSPSPMGSASR